MRIAHGIFLPRADAYGRNDDERPYGNRDGADFVLHWSCFFSSRLAKVYATLGTYLHAIAAIDTIGFTGASAHGTCSAAFITLITLRGGKETQGRKTPRHFENGTKGADKTTPAHEHTNTQHKYKHSDAETHLPQGKSMLVGKKNRRPEFPYANGNIDARLPQKEPYPQT